MSIPFCPSGQPVIDSPAFASPPELQPDVPLERQAAFVQVLAQWGNVRAAAQQVGVSRAHLYRMRRASAQFRRLWDAALVLARPQVEEVLADRALNGVQEVVYYHGEEVATRTRYDSRLLLAHLGRLDRIAGAAGVHATVRDFDAEVERLLDPPALYDWDDAEEAEDWEDERWEGDGGGEDDAVPEDEEGDAGAGGDTAADADEHGPADEADAAADALSEGGRSAGSGAAGFASLDSVSCVSNRRCGQDAGGDTGQGRDGPSGCVLHH